jgi:hypothetical protein
VKFTASVNSQRDLALFKLQAEGGNAIFDLFRIKWETRIANVRRCDQLAHALVYKAARVLNALFKVARAIIDGGQNVAVDIYV